MTKIWGLNLRDIIATPGRLRLDTDPLDMHRARLELERQETRKTHKTSFSNSLATKIRSFSISLRRKGRRRGRGSDE